MVMLLRGTGGGGRMPIAILILAAGASRRMRGMDKLLEPVKGRPLLAHVVQMALQSGLGVTVTLPPDRPARAAALVGLQAHLVTVPDAGTGMATSLRAGVATLPEGGAVMVLLADMPEVDGADLRAMIDAYRTTPGQIHPRWRAGAPGDFSTQRTGGVVGAARRHRRARPVGRRRRGTGHPAPRPCHN
jgi:CTP:molybdopterin cytidylyltransferase MocA